MTGTVTLPEGTEMVMPGDNVTITVELITPVAMEEGMRLICGALGGVSYGWLFPLLGI